MKRAGNRRLFYIPLTVSLAVLLPGVPGQEVPCQAGVRASNGMGDPQAGMAVLSSSQGSGE